MPCAIRQVLDAVRMITDDEADLIIAKGQGNFELLGDTEKKAFFLLRPKCAVLARHLNCEQGRLMVIESGATQE